MSKNVTETVVVSTPNERLSTKHEDNFIPLWISTVVQDAQRQRCLSDFTGGFSSFKRW